MYTKGLVSVIIPSYNHQQWIGAAIESVVSQTYKNIELIIIDDCSPDDSLIEIKKYAEKYDFIQVLVNEQNKGACYSHAKALKHATGEFLAVLNSDDLWYAQKLELQTNFLNTHPEISAVFSLVDFIDGTGTKLNRPDLKRIFEKENRNRFQWIRDFVDNGNSLCHPSILIRHQVFETLGEYCKYPLKQLPDFELWMRLCIDHEIHIFPKELVAYRIHEYNESVGIGIKSHSIIHTELIYILNNLKKIKTVEDLMKIFPEYKYMMKVNNPILIPFYLAKILNLSNVGFKNIWSTLELYNCLTNPAVAHLIRKHNLMSLKEFYTIVEDNDICKLQSAPKIPITNSLSQMVTRLKMVLLAKTPRLAQFLRPYYVKLKKVIKWI